MIVITSLALIGEGESSAKKEKYESKRTYTSRKKAIHLCYYCNFFNKIQTIKSENAIFVTKLKLYEDNAQKV